MNVYQTLERTSSGPAFVGGQPVLAQRLLPAARRYTVPAGKRALLVRDDRAVVLLDAGTHRVRTVWQSVPELYQYRVDAHWLPLWLTQLATADGKPVNLGWRVRVQVADASQVWASWLCHLEGEWLPLPAEQLSARLADPAQDLVQRYVLSDLRADGGVRSALAAELHLLLHRLLSDYGLELAASPDPQQLRFMTEADVVAARREQEVLRRALADEQLRSELNRIDNEAVLVARLREVAAGQGVALDAERAVDLVQSARSENDPKTVAALQRSLAAPSPLSTSAPVVLPTVGNTPQPRWFRRLSLLVLITALVAALILAAIWIYRPDLITTDGGRNQVVAAVAGIAIFGVLVAWVLDQVIRWQAHNSAERMLIEANLEGLDHKESRLQVRHVLMLLGALLGVGVSTAALWIPDHINWLRMVGSVLGLLGAAFAIRIDWLYNIHQANRVVAQARRQITNAQLNGAQRARSQAKLRLRLGAELEVVRRRLQQSADLAYRIVGDRSLHRRIRALDDPTVKTLLLRVQTLEDLLPERVLDEWAEVDAQIDRLQQTAQQCSSSAEALQRALQQNSRGEAIVQMDKLDDFVHTMLDELTRWKATVA